MQEDFHYYATYCAAILAGYDHKDSMQICYSAQFVDLCTKSLLSKIGAPLNAATTQLQLELADTRTDLLGLQDVTRIWSSFHFLPKDLYAVKPKRTKRYMNKYRLICGPNGDLAVKTVKLAKDKSLQHIGVAMHVIADTWAHANFAGTPSLVINNTTNDFFELVPAGDGSQLVKSIKFRHSPSMPDDLDNSIYTNTVYQGSENSIMNLGHGRAGHLPDYSFATYRYVPAWDDYKEVTKDNPGDYLKAFAQMVQAMKYLRGDIDDFTADTYADDTIAPCLDRINAIIRKRQLNACEDWKAFGEELSGQTVEDFDVNKYQAEYTNADKAGKDSTFLGRFIKAALSQKGMVAGQIEKSGNRLAGFVKMKIILSKEVPHD